MISSFETVALAYQYSDTEGINIFYELAPARDISHLGVNVNTIGLLRFDKSIKEVRRQTHEFEGYKDIRKGEFKNITIPIPRKPEDRIEYVYNGHLTTIIPRREIKQRSRYRIILRNYE